MEQDKIAEICALNALGKQWGLTLEVLAITAHCGMTGSLYEDLANDLRPHSDLDTARWSIADVICRNKELFKTRMITKEEDFVDYKRGGARPKIVELKAEGRLLLNEIQGIYQ